MGSPISIRSQLEEAPYRLTDYPRSQSPDSLSRRSSLSVSVLSESSLTSEGSSIMSYDANKVPKKKILKDPHRRHKKQHNSRSHHVRFNLVGDESDNSSVYSFESTSTTSEIYRRARSSVSDVMHGWRGEFEFSPPRGSTGLTPSKHLYPYNPYQQHHHHRHHHHHHHSSPSQTHLSHQKFILRQDQKAQPPKLHQTHSDSSLLNYSSASSQATLNVTGGQQSLLGGAANSPSHAVSRPAQPYPAVSLPQLNINGRVLSDPAAPQTGKVSSQEVLQSTSPLASSTYTSTSRHLNESTPLSHSHSEGMIGLKARALNTPGRGSLTARAQISVLRLNSSSIPELEESTLEDRKRQHIFQFPQNSPDPGTSCSGQQHNLLATPAAEPHPQKGVGPPTNRMLFVEDDDGDDYDHLSPLEKERSEVPDEKSIKNRRSKERDSNKNSATANAIKILQVQRSSPGARKKTEAVNAPFSTDQESFAAAAKTKSYEEKPPPPVPKKLGPKAPNETIEDQSSRPLHPDRETSNYMKVPRRNHHSNSSSGLQLSSSGTRHRTEGKVTNIEYVSSRSSVPILPTGPDEKVALAPGNQVDYLESRHSSAAPAPPNQVEKHHGASSAATAVRDAKPRRHKKEKVPPPLPKKTTRIRRQDRDALGNPLTDMAMSNYSSSSQSTNETSPSQELPAEADIVPPPPEFSFSDHEFTNQFDAASAAPQEDDVSASNSSTTLVSEPQARQQHQDESDLPLPTESSSPTSRKHRSKKNKASQHLHLLQETRAEANAERSVTFGSSSDARQSQAGTSVVDFEKKRLARNVASESVLLHSRNVKESTSAERKSTSNLQPSGATSQLASARSKPSSSPHTDRTTKGLKEGKSGTDSSQATTAPPRRVPARPAPPPPSRTTSAASVRPPQPLTTNERAVTEEERHALQLVYPASGEVPMMSSTVHDTDKHIQDMLIEINSEQGQREAGMAASANPFGESSTLQAMLKSGASCSKTWIVARK